MPDDARQNRLGGRRILVVEDEYLIAAELQRELEQFGAEVLGPVPSVSAALDLLADDTAVDGAILDVNVRGETVFPVADAAQRRGVPFVFATGYDHFALPERYASMPRCEKPIDVQQIAKVLFAGSGR